MKILGILLLSVFTLYPEQRYFFSGDGKLALKGGEQSLQNLSPRLIALLDYLQDKLGSDKKEMRILSGYRSPEYNEGLRKKGGLAGKASLHTEGMAADFTLKGVDAKKIWEFVRAMNCCGVGYYHGDAVHVDTGPARFWYETSSKVFTGIAEHNKQVYLATEFDIYRPGEKIGFDIVRITEYPFGIQLGKGCRLIASRDKAKNLEWMPPGAKKFRNKPQSLQLKVCQKPSPEMPDTLSSNTFIIASPK